MGAKKFGMSSETKGNQTFWRDMPGFCFRILGAPEKFEKKKVYVQFSSPSSLRNAWFAQTDSCGFVNFVVSGMSANPALNSLFAAA